jgi:arylsulfatase A-like enzyme
VLFLKSLGNHLKVGILYGFLVAVYLTLFDSSRALLSPYLTSSPECVRSLYLRLELVSNLIVFVALGLVGGVLLSIFLPRFERCFSRPRLFHLGLHFAILQYLQLVLLLKIDAFSDTGELRTWAALLGFFLVGTSYLLLLDHLLKKVSSRLRLSARNAGIVSVLVALLSVASVVSADRTAGAQVRSGGAGPNLLLLTIDTLRFDHLSYNGYYRNTSPTIDSLSEEAVVFDNAYTPLPRTAPALASLLTGSYPHRHGVRSNGHHILAESNVTLAEILSGHGFRTAAFVHNPVLSPFRGLSQGFQDYSEVYGLASQLERIPALRLIKDLGLRVPRRYVLDWNANLDTGLATSWLKGCSGDRFFLWLHYLEPHTPYSPPPRYVDLYGNDYRGRYRWGFSFTPEEQRENTFGCKLPRKDIRRAVDLYDSEIRYVDDQIGRLMKYLEESGLAENTLIVFASDHGEGLGEHDYFFEHGDFLYQHNSKVPLFFIVPGSNLKAHIQGPVSLNDVFPTVLELLGLQNGQEIDGTSLLPYFTGQGAEPERPIFGETGICYYPEKNDRILIKVVHQAFAPMAPEEWFGNYDSLYIASKQRMVLRWPWKLIYTPDGGAGVCELYNLKEDPGELYNLAETEPVLREHLKSEVYAWLEEGRKLYSPVGAAIEGEVREALKALGYIR